MNHLKSLIAEQLVEKRISREAAKELLRALSQPGQQEQIAVIGMAGRFSSTRDIDQFWEFLKLGRTGIRSFPEARQADMREVFANPSYAELILGAPVAEADLPHLYAKSGYMERIDTFDAAYFGIPPLEADYMDPNQRLALEVAHEALENAGYGGPASHGSRTGVFLGRDHANFSFYRMASERHPMQLSGSWEGLAASRISYVFDLKGPCLVTDTACSAGAVSIHLAIQSLLAGECDTALAGGINLSSIGEPKANFMSGATMDSVESADDTIRTFDARANGTLWGEGVGMVLLKPLRQAIADRDNIRAVVLATAINNDGTSNSITAPNALQQEQVILDAWKRAAVDPATISYVEAHGTGTVLGDPIEIKGLTSAFRRHTDRRQFCAIGSLKTTMGHMVAASGVASLAKVVRSLETKALAPSANFQVPNPFVNFSDSPLYVNDRLTPWETDGPRRAAINSFGFIRTNCHLVLEEAPAPLEALLAAERYCLTISARTPAAQARLLDAYAEALEDEQWNWADACYTSNVGRAHHEHRTMLVARSRAELGESLDWARSHPGASDPSRGVSQGHHKVVSDKKRELSAGELTGARKRDLTRAAAAVVVRHRSIRHPHDLAELAALYAEGADVEFTALHEGDPRRRVPLPTYSFEPTRHWARPMRTAVTVPTVAVAAAAPEPLCGAEALRTDTRLEFERLFEVTDWVLADHRIGGRAVLPGTVYLEMVRAAFALATGSDRLGLSNAIFLQPLTVEEGAPVSLRTRLDAEGDGFRFVVSSLDDTGRWTDHAEGRVDPLQEPAPTERVDVPALRAAATEVADPFVGEAETGVFTFGPHWDVVRAIWRGDAGVLARFALPAGLEGETDCYRLHPSLLDNAVNLISQTGADTYLPYVYRSLKLYGPMPETFHSLIRVVRDGQPGDETITYDVDLADESGAVFARVQDYTVKKVDWARFRAAEADRCLRLGWTPVEAETVPADGCWAVVVSDTDAGAAVLDAARASGLDVRAAVLGEVADPAAGRFGRGRDGISTLVTSWRDAGVDGVAWLVEPTSDLGPLDPARRDGLTDLLRLTSALVAERFRLPRGLRVGVEGAAQVSAAEAGTPFGTATAALAKVVGQENAHLGVRVVDVAPDASSEDLVGVVRAGGPALQAHRGGRVWVPRLTAATLPGAEYDDTFRGGVYLVTGGLGGLGRAVAETMVAQGAERVLLVGRRDPSPEESAWLAGLAGVDHHTCDVADPEALGALADALDAEGVRLSGIVHAAGVAGAGFLAGKSDDEFTAVLRPKVDGGLGVLALARRHPGAFLVLFASITGVVGGPGQGDYAAANAFLDGLASLARAEGIPAVAIDWPSWAEVGMAVRHGVGEDDSLVRPLSVAQGLTWLQRLLRDPAPGVVPGELNLEVARANADDLGTLLDLPGGTRAPADAPVASGDGVRLRGLGEPTIVQQRVADAFGAVLGLTEIDAFAGFQELGGNSLMTTQLLKLVDEAYPGVVDIADLFSYASIADLAGFIADQVQDEPAAGEAAEAGDLLRDVLDELGDAELLEMFSGGEEAGL